VQFRLVARRYLLLRQRSFLECFSIDIFRRLAMSTSSVCFSDDDDLWSPQRIQLIHAECHAAAHSTSALLCRRKARPAPKGNSCERQVEPEDAAYVHFLLASGEAVLCDSDRNVLELGKGESSQSFHRAEYFDYCLRFEVLSRFLRLAPAGLLAHTLCDLGFTRWIKDNCSVRRFEPSEPSEWVYWYGRALGSTSASQEVDVQPNEIRLARRVRGNLFDSDSAAARFLAVLRQRLEQELVQLRVRLDPGTAGIVPRQIIESACRSQVSCLVSAAARTWPTEAVPQLQAWALRQARGPITERLLRTLEFEAVVCLQTHEVTIVCSNRCREDIMRGLHEVGALPHGLLANYEIIPS